MSLTPDSIKRAVDASGDDILTFETAGSKQVQAVALVDNIGAQVDLSEYGTNDVEEASSVITYVGKEKRDGTWLVMKIDTSSGTSIRYASVENNALITAYDDAWTGRATLTYGTYAEAL